MHSSMISTTSHEDLSNITPENIYYDDPESVLEGKWEEVKRAYKNNPEYHTTMINDTVGTALHVAVDLNEESVVKELVDAIITHRDVAALEIGNEHGDTPLHVAAMKGLTKICECIIGMNKERVYLARLKNKYWETPLFQAANNGEQKAFAYLSDILGNNAPLEDLNYAI